VPTLTWSPDGRFLAFTNHDSSDPEALTFSSWAVDVVSGVNGRFIPDSGMWAHLHWNPAGDEIVFLKATDPLDSQRSSYALWLMDGDGSNGRRLYPPPGELTRFSIEQSFMAWGPDGQQIAFIFDDTLYIFDVETAEARLISQEDAVAGHPTWAPYGAGQSVEIPDPSSNSPIPTRRGSNQFLPDQ
jgi:Tol biopolymer transport system component